jgi:hypothetical protein
MLKEADMKLAIALTASILSLTMLEARATAPTDDVCVERAVSATVARIDHPTTSDYFAQRGGTPAKTAPASVAAR